MNNKHTSKTILIVDDEDKARLYLAQILQELHPDYEIKFAASPAEALFIFNCSDIDLIFLDVEMPGMTGLDLLSKMREKQSDVPVIFVSAFKRAEFIQQALRLDAVDYIDKPVDPGELETAIQKSFKSHFAFPVSRSETSSKLVLFTELGDMIFNPDEILCFESDKRNSIAYFSSGAKNVVVRENLVGLETILPAESYVRVSRQHIVNKRYIKFVSRSNKTIIVDTGNVQIKIDKVYPDIIDSLTLVNL